MNIKPINNHCILEICDEYAGIIRDTENENTNKGILISHQLTQLHITASNSLILPAENLAVLDKELTALQGSVVYYQEYADSGKKFKVGDKQYVQVFFWQLTGFELN
jgi:co-chaperonin GroES (HSP10)